MIFGTLAQVSFDHPWWLACEAAPLLLVLWQKFSRRAIESFLVLSAALACLALSEPRVSVPPRSPQLVVLLDVSQSRSPLDLAEGERWLTQVRAEGRFGQVRVGRFAAAVEEVACSSRPCVRPFGDQRDRDTDLARAMLWGAAQGEAAAGDVLVLWSDGRDADERAASVAGALRDAGWSVLRGGFAPTDGPPRERAPLFDVAVPSLENVGPPPRPDETFRVVVSLAATRDTRVRLTVTQDDKALQLPSAQLPSAPGPAGPDRLMTLARGVTPLALELHFPAGRESTTVRATVSPVDAAGGEVPDAWPGNDAATAVFTAARSASAWIVEAEPHGRATAGKALAALLTRAGFLVRRSTPTEVARASVGVEPPALLWLIDTAASELSATSVQRLEETVRGGAGLIVTGGSHAFDRGGYAHSPLESLLPVLTDDSLPAEEASLALELVLDRSGSMAGPKLELTREAARAAARLLPDRAWLGVVAFDSQALSLVAPQPLTNRLRVESDLDRLSASGGTNILAGLRMAIDELRNVRARRKHVILLSDGQSSAEGLASLVDSARDTGITVSTVAVGDGADQHLLRLIATRGGGRSYFTTDPERLPRLFMAETSTVLGPARPVALPRVAMAGSHLVTQEIGARALPRPSAVARTKLRSQGELLLEAASLPLLSCWSVGLGRSCAYAAELVPPGARTSVSEEPARLLTQLARYASRSTRANEGDLHWQQLANVVRLTWAPPPTNPTAKATPTPNAPSADPSAATVLSASATLSAAGRDPVAQLALVPDPVANVWRGTLRADLRGEGVNQALNPSRPLQADLEIAATTTHGAFTLRRSVSAVSDTEGPAWWEGQALPFWWKELPLARPDIAPRSSNVPPPRREWPCKTSLLVAAAASVIVAAWRRYGRARPRGLPYPSPRARSL